MGDVAAEIVVYLCQLGGLSEQDVATAAGTSRSTVTAWVRGRRHPAGERLERLAELSALVKRLVRAIDPGYVACWLKTPVPALGDQNPLDVVAAGECRRVSALVAQLESPVAS